MTKRQSRHRNSEATEFPRKQRTTANEFAHDVWQMVRNRQCCGEKFRREVVIEPFTVDFCCIDLKLVVEVDGKHHITDVGISTDRKRDQYLEQLGYKILRIPGYEVLREPVSARSKIVEAIIEIRGAGRPLTPSPSPPKTDSLTLASFRGRADSETDPRVNPQMHLRPLG